MPFIKMVMSGMSSAMMRLTKRFVLVKAAFACSKRSSSCACVLKARTTIMPESPSRATRLTSSTCFCILVNLGSTTSIKMTMAQTTTASATPTTIPSAEMPDAVFTALITPPMPMMGAYMTMRKKTMEKICICVMSLVERVMSEETEKELYSLEEKLSTLSKISARKSFDMPEPTREARKLTIMDEQHAAKAIASIMPPVLSTFVRSEDMMPSEIIEDI